MAPSEDDTKTPRSGDLDSGEKPGEDEDSASTQTPEDDPEGASSDAPELLERFFWLDPAMDERLRQTAEETGRSESEIVRELLRAHYRLD